MRELERYEAEQLVLLLESRGGVVVPGLQERAHLAIRMMHGQLISQLLHGPGPFDAGDPRLVDELTLLLARYLAPLPED